MTSTLEKIVLSVIFVVLIGFNSFFILGHQDDEITTTSTSTSVGKMNSYVPVREADDDDENEQDEDISLEQLQTINGRLTEEQAKAIALETIGSGSVIDFEAEREDGRLIYGITIRAQGDTVEVEIDAVTGEVLEIEWGDDDEEDDD